MMPCLQWIIKKVAFCVEYRMAVRLWWWDMFGSAFPGASISLLGAPSLARPPGRRVRKSVRELTVVLHDLLSTSPVVHGLDAVCQQRLPGAGDEHRDWTPESQAQDKGPLPPAEAKPSDSSVHPGSSSQASVGIRSGWRERRMLLSRAAQQSYSG